MKKKILVVIIVIIIVTVGIFIFNHLYKLKKSYHNLNIELTEQTKEINIDDGVIKLEDYIKNYFGKLLIKSENQELNSPYPIKTIGEYKIVYTVEDEYKQSKSSAIIFKVVDITKPIIMNNGSTSYRLKPTDTLDVMKNIEVKDNYSTDLLEQIKISSPNECINNQLLENKTEIEFSQCPEGTYSINYDVTDLSGNKADTVTLEIIIEAVKEEKSNSSKNNSSNKSNGGDKKNGNSGNNASGGNNSGNKGLNETTMFPWEQPLLKFRISQYGSIEAARKACADYGNKNSYGWACYEVNNTDGVLIGYRITLAE